MLVAVDPDGTGPAPATTYAYDALNRRVSEDKDGPDPVTGSAHPTVNLYHSANWQVLEERLAGSTSARTQYVWSPVYVDALVLRDRDADNNASTGANGLEERLYVANEGFAFVAGCQLQCDIAL